MNTTMDKMAVGSIFQFGHNRDGKGHAFIKVSNALARRTDDAPDAIPGWNAPPDTTQEGFANIPVTYLGMSKPSDK